MDNTKGVINVEILYKAELEKLNKELKKAEAAVLEYEKKTSNKSGWAYEQGLKKKQTALASALRKREALYRKYNSSITGISQKTADKEVLIEKQKNAKIAAEQKKAANTYISKFKRAFGTLTRYFGAYQIINAVVASFRYLGTELLKVQQNLARVSAITDASVSQMKHLRDVVYSVSAKYGIAASEVSKFTIEMAKLGKTAGETGDIAESAAQLSKILGEDMVTSGTLLVTTMNQYGLSVKEAGRVTSTFFNVIAKSPADINGLKTALQYVGVTARNVGFTIEETGQMIAFLARNGIKMSKIGNGLRNVLSKVAKMGGNVKDTFDELSKSGIDVEDAFKQFGLRGGNVAQLLIGKWSEVKKLMKNDIPAAGDRMLRTAKAMDSYLSDWARFKASFISFFGGAKISQDLIKSQQLLSLLDKQGISLNELNTEYRNLAKNKKNVSAIADELAKKFGITKSIYTNGVEAETGAYQALKLYVKTSFDEDKTRKSLDETRDKANAFLQDQIKKMHKSGNKVLDLGSLFVDNGIGGIETAKKVTKNTKTYKQYLLDMFKSVLSEDEAMKQVDELIANQNNLYSTQYQPDLQKNLERRKEFIKRREEARLLLKKGELSDKDFQSYKADVSDVEKQICDQSNNAFSFCPGYKKSKNGTKHRKDIRNEISSYYNDYRETIALAIEEYQKTMSGITKLSDIRIDDNGVKRKNALSLSDWMEKNGYLPGKKEFESKKMVDDYAKYAIDFNENVRKKVNESSSKMVQAEATLFGKKDSATRLAIEQFKELKNETDKTAIGYSELTSKIGTLTSTLPKLRGEYSKSSSTIIAASDKANAAIDVNIDKIKKLTDTEKEAIKYNRKKLLLQELSDVLSSALNIYKTFNQEVLANTMARFNAQLEASKAHYSEEGDILRAQVENNLITQSQYAKRRKALEKKRIEEENKIKKAQFEAQKENDIQSAIIGGIVAAAQAMIAAIVASIPDIPLGVMLGGISAGLIAAETAAQVAAINKRQFYPVKYATGGWIDGQSHASGGVPISMNGNNNIEAEGGEFIINKRSAAKNAGLIEDINRDEDFTNKLVNALSSAPIRAYFTDKDLDAAERNRTFRTNSANYLN
jgi:hypothetical protein